MKLTKKEVGNPTEVYEELKERMIDFSISYSKAKAKARRQDFKKLQKKLTGLEKRLTCINLESNKAIQHIEKINIKIDEVKIKMEEELSMIARGAMIRAKVRWQGQAELNTKYFFQLEKSRSKNKFMTTLERTDGSISQSIAEILDLQTSFYQKLYTKDDQVVFIPPDLPHKELSAETKKGLDVPVTIEEIGHALREMANNKSPGLDGLTMDFYKFFYGRLKGILFDLYSYCYEVKCLHPSARDGVITLIPKKNRNLLELKSWRPICLLCSDFKIIAKVIANRLKSVLNEIIEPEQNAFVQGRNISNNIRKTMDIVEQANKMKLAAVLIQVDFEKAFDRVHYDSLMQALKYFNFGEGIISWMQIFFRNIQLRTTNGGHLSKPFTPTRGLFQGNPLGPYDFVILIEILAIMLRGNKDIKPITINEVKYLLSMFADDLDLFMKYDQNSWNEVIATFSKYESLNIRRILDLIEYAEQEDIPGIILSMDFYKCFDLIETESLIRSLRYFGAGDSFTNWTRLIYNKAQSCVINQGECSQFFPVTRSVRQGGCCSAYYFLVIAEVLAIELKNSNPKIKGIFLTEMERILGQFADDMDLYLLGDSENLKQVFRIVKEFENQSGFKISYDKTTVYRIGSLKNSDAKLYTENDIKWTNDAVNVLGVNVSGNERDLSKNYEDM